MFNNDNSNTNGELFLYSFISKHIETIFDVGCRNDSLFKKFVGSVHYFDPFPEAIESLKKQDNLNKNSHFNNIALSDKKGEAIYYPKYQSLHNRTKTCSIDDSENKKAIQVTTGDDYMESNGIPKIDFLKIDVEGHELSVIKGFKNNLTNINIIQFEYGGTYIDSEVKLIDIKNYLNDYFLDFCYLDSSGLVKIKNYEDHYNYCNIVCFNKNYNTSHYDDLIYA